MMVLLGQDVLRRAIRKHPVIGIWIQDWIDAVVRASWRNLQELRHDFPSADGVKLRSSFVVTVFNVKGNEYRLLVSVDYIHQRVDALEVLTHAEYNKDAWKRRY